MQVVHLFFSERGASEDLVGNWIGLGFDLHADVSGSFHDARRTELFSSEVMFKGLLVIWTVSFLSSCLRLGLGGAL